VKEQLMKWKAFMAGYFTFTRRERIGLVLLIFVIIITFLLPAMISNTNTRFVPADTVWIAAVKKLETIKTDKEKKLFDSRTGDADISYSYDRSVSHSPASGTLFYFDPNTIDEAAWKQLGLKDKTIHTIKNYLSKGGHFYKTEDLKKVYGLHSNDYSRLEPYIKIKADISEEKAPVYTRKENESKRFSYNSIDINTADSTAFIALPGIGSKLALRITNFRDKLGGFYAVTQVGETYGLADSTFQKIKQYFKIENTSLKKIDINIATLDELKSHPYIRYAIARALVAYRNEHGLFKQIEDIKQVMVITNEVYNKVSPYLIINN
jgi:competence protein ComEA